jgi:hypothetical protein
MSLAIGIILWLRFDIRGAQDHTMNWSLLVPPQTLKLPDAEKGLLRRHARPRPGFRRGSAQLPAREAVDVSQLRRLSTPPQPASITWSRVGAGRVAIDIRRRCRRPLGA